MASQPTWLHWVLMSNPSFCRRTESERELHILTCLKKSKQYTIYGRQVYTVKHILIECIDLDLTRERKLYERTIFKKTKEVAIMTFLTAVSLYGKI